MDDFSGEMPLVQLLRLLDRYSVQVPFKGGYLWFCPDTIVITTNVHPRKWYNYWERDSSFEALKRRIHVVFDFNQLSIDYVSTSGRYQIGKRIRREKDAEEYNTWMKNSPSIVDVLMPLHREGLFHVH